MASQNLARHTSVSNNPRSSDTFERRFSIDSDEEAQARLLSKDDDCAGDQTATQARRRPLFKKAVKSLCVLLLVVLAATFLVLEVSHESPRCGHIRVRREWRQLNETERQAYIDSIKCLHSTPALLRNNANDTRYDDFAWVHQENSMQTHQTAAFLSWHRQFLHVFEETLRTTCGFEGTLPFWDWTLDWEDPAASIVWDPRTGFGGNGRHNATDRSFCVADGPFANFQVQYWQDTFHPHCLIRNFASDNGSGHFSGDKWRPQTVATVLNQNTYERFLGALELGPHDGAPFGIRGDFGGFTAPNDPVFYLHHTQLDRLWWSWQQGDPERLVDYSGPTERGTAGGISTLDDQLLMYGLGRDIRVRDVMDTTAWPFCYSY